MHGEEEDESAQLAAVALGDVEVENGGNVGRHFAVIGGAICIVGRRLGHGNDEMRELVLPIEIGRARWRRRRRRGTLRGAAASLQSDLFGRARGALARAWRRRIDVIANRCAGQACIEIGTAIILQFAAAANGERRSYGNGSSAGPSTS